MAPTARHVVDWLRAHPIAPKQQTPDFLTADDTRSLWLVRWPNGSIKWETVGQLAEKRLSVPARGVLESTSPH